MDTTLEFFRWAHGGLGVVCMIAGVVALTAPKRAGRHVLSGRAFVWVLLGVYLAVLPLIVVRTNLFMAGIGWLAVSAGFEGWRSLLRFKRRIPVSAQAFDRVLQVLNAVAGVVMAGFGVSVLVTSQNLMGGVLVGFGLFALLLARGSHVRGRAALAPSAYLALHIRFMCGAFSAALTAFLALQLSGKVGGWEWVVWVLPVVLMNQYGAREVRKRGLDTPQTPKA